MQPVAMSFAEVMGAELDLLNAFFDEQKTWASISQGAKVPQRQIVVS